MMERMRANGKAWLLETCVIVALMVASAQVGMAAPADLAHQTDFLTAECFTQTYAGLSSSARQSCLRDMQARNYTHMYVYVYNEEDYGGPRFDYYQDPQGFRSLLQEIRGAGLLPVVFLHPDDAPVNKKRPVEELKSRLDALIPVIDSLVSSYVLGLELDEYWPFEKANQLGQHLNGLTRKKIAAHQLPGRWDYCQQAGWCDYMILQYGFGKSLEAIADMTREALRDLRRPVVAGEYNLRGEEDKGQKMGDAAVAAGAVGFGNGGSGLGAAPPDTTPPASPVGLKINR
jgi:hypothetical protein